MTLMDDAPTGFTLIELLIAIIIIVLLVELAFPGYQNSILQTRRAEARSALHSVMLQQERFYTQHNTYSVIDPESKDSPFKWWSGDSVETSYYAISATSCAGRQLDQCVLLTATSGVANVGQVDDPICGSLMLDSLSNKSYSNGTEPNSLCW